MHSSGKLGAFCVAVGLLGLGACSQSERTQAGALYSPTPAGDNSQQSDPATVGQADGAGTGGADANAKPGGDGTARGSEGEGSGAQPGANPGAADCDAATCGAPAVGDGTDPAFSGPSSCSSGLTWLFGNQRTELMRPGLACNECHRRSFQEVYTVAGTLYATGHEPDDCFGASGVNNDFKVEVSDANGKVVSMTPNLSGNFRTSEHLTFPITTRVLSGGKERPMLGEVDAAGGDCNTCHTDNGKDDAPGRIAIP